MALNKAGLVNASHGPRPEYVYTVGADDITAGGYFTGAWDLLPVGALIGHRPTAGGMLWYIVAVSSASGVSIGAASPAAALQNLNATSGGRHKT